MQFIVTCQFLLLACVLPQINSENNYYETRHLNSSRIARQIYSRNIAPTSCAARIGTLLVKGICDTLASCIVNAGEVVGVCPGDAVCCLVLNTCGQVSSTRVSYFTSPNFPTIFTTTSPFCELRIRPYVKSRTCQAHLEFVTFDLAQPASTGICETDSFTVTGSDPNYEIPVLCGDNTEQHMFLKFTSYGGEIVLRIKATNRNWIIRITQTPCTSVAELPPAGCLQFFNGSSGTVKSFNHGVSVFHNLANQNYDICLRPLTVNCSYEWTPTVFDITPQVLTFSESCLSNDYVSVLSATSSVTTGTGLPNPTTTEKSNVICGQNQSPSGTVLKKIQAFASNRMRVVFNNNAEGEGFRMRFNVNCSNAVLASVFTSLL